MFKNLIGRQVANKPLSGIVDGEITVGIIEGYGTGLMLGLAYAAPIGAQNMFVIRTASSRRYRVALATALLVALNDVTLAVVCFWGIGGLLLNNAAIKQVMIICGAAILAKLAYSAFRNAWKQGVLAGAGQELSNARFSPLVAAMTAASLTWFNPQAILDGTLLLGGYRAIFTDPGLAAWFLIGVGTASLSWFIILSTTVAYAAQRGGTTCLRALNFASAGLLAALSLNMISQLVHII